MQDEDESLSITALEPLGSTTSMPSQSYCPHEGHWPENESFPWTRGNWGPPEGLPEAAMVLLIVQLRCNSHTTLAVSVFPSGKPHVITFDLSQVTVFTGLSKAPVSWKCKLTIGAVYAMLANSSFSAEGPLGLMERILAQCEVFGTSDA